MTAPRIPRSTEDIGHALATTVCVAIAAVFGCIAIAHWLSGVLVP